MTPLGQVDDPSNALMDLIWNLGVLEMLETEGVMMFSKTPAFSSFQKVKRYIVLD